MKALAAATAFAASVAPAQAGPVFTSRNVEAKPARFPIQIPKEGPVDLQLQILLDKAGFSPGIIDGAWGINAAKAMTFFTEPDDTKRLTGDSPPPVTTVDKATYNRLRAAARGKRGERHAQEHKPAGFQRPGGDQLLAVHDLVDTLDAIIDVHEASRAGAITPNLNFICAIQSCLDDLSANCSRRFFTTPIIGTVRTIYIVESRYASL